MPRIDRTFSSKDILRIWKDHLTFQEQRDVLAIFRFLTFEKDTDDQTFLNYFGSFIGTVPVLGDAIELSIEIFQHVQELRLLADLGLEASQAADRSGISQEEILSFYQRLMAETPPPPPGPPVDLE